MTKLAATQKILENHNRSNPSKALGGRSIVVRVTGFKLTISMSTLIRLSCNLVEILFEVL